MYRTNGLGVLATMLSDADNAAERMAFADFLIARQAQQREQALLVIEGHNAATREITAARNQQAALLSRQEAALRTLQERFAEAKRLADAERRRQARAAAERARAARREAAAGSKPPAPPPGGDRPAPPDPVRPAPPPARPAPPPVRPAPPRRNVACPVGQPRTYIDSWGAARSGGRSHQGTDILAPYGTTVYAYVSGRISRAKVGGGLGGTVIYLQGDNGHEYYYAHLASFSVRTGQRVRVGQAIARNGSTGNAPPNAPHVHFEVHPGGGRPVNPYPYVRQACH
jgi:murein DD-endopeptidase MepM/ murein hydrolase activator NlpD